MPKTKSWTPLYPKTGYTLLIQLAKKRSARKAIYALRNFCKTASSIDRYVDDILQLLEKELAGHYIQSIYVAKLRFSRNWPLKKSYWQNPGTGFDDELRDKLFVTFLDQYQARASGWLMLVTPDSKIGRKQQLTVPMPLRLISREQDAEAFMAYSNWPVDPTATHAALYTVEDLSLYTLSQPNTTTRLRNKK